MIGRAGVPIHCGNHATGRRKEEPSPGPFANGRKNGRHRDPRQFLESLFDSAVAAADPMRVLTANLPERPKGRTVVIGAGKGAAQMAQAFETLWPGPISGAVATRYGFGVPCRHIEVLEASHPLPMAAGYGPRNVCSPRSAA